MTEKTNLPIKDIPGPVARIADALFAAHPHLAPAKENLFAAYQAAVDNFDRAGVLYICGNGGSFADAIHIKGELGKCFTAPRPLTDKNVLANLATTPIGQKLATGLEMGFPVVVLGESHSLRSAFENDRDPEHIYAQELISFVPWVKTGLLLAISTSGNSKSVLAAMTLAKAYKIPAIAFTGPVGGHMANIADIAWRVPGESTYLIQENQIVLYHAWCRMIEARYFGS